MNKLSTGLARVPASAQKSTASWLDVEMSGVSSIDPRQAVQPGAATRGAPLASR